jgi:two-component SAPR family response regulator
MTFKAKSDKTFFKNLLTKQKKYGITQTERKVRTMKAKSLGHLNMNAISKLYDGGIYDTKKYRYIVDQGDGEIYRIEKDLLGTTEALDPENWIRQ